MAQSDVDYQAQFDHAVHALKQGILTACAAVEQQFNAVIDAKYVTGKGLDLKAGEAPRPKLQGYTVKASNTVPLAKRQPQG